MNGYEEFRAFLIEKNNHHWSGLQRLGPKMCADISVLRGALTTLLDEGQSIEKRLNQAIGQVTGMGTAVATAILFVAYPAKYGVWNSTSEGGLKALNLWPHFERGESVGERYVKVNQILNKVSSDLGIDLWTLDMLWWPIQNLGPESEPSWSEVQTERLPDENVGDAVRFSLERHLHDFLRDNWQDTSLGREWDIYSEPGEPEKGYEYPCGVGRIDLLARHKTKPDWLIIELKRRQTSDVTVGQLLRYMGWVKSHLSEPDETVPSTASASSTTFTATEPLVINGTKYNVPTDTSVRCVVKEQTGYNENGVQYTLSVPQGWVVVWDSYKAYWSDGKYETDGLLAVYGKWEGAVKIVNGEYCAVPVEWVSFALNDRRNAVPRPNRQEFHIGNIP